MFYETDTNYINSLNSTKFIEINFRHTQLIHVQNRILKPIFLLHLKI